MQCSPVVLHSHTPDHASSNELLVPRGDFAVCTSIEYALGIHPGSGLGWQSDGK